MLEEREKAFEAKYQHDQELQFRVQARRARLFGEWVATRLGLSGAAIADYAKAMVATDQEQAGDADLLAKAEADLAAHGQAVPRDQLLAELARLLPVAKQQLQEQV